MRCRLGARGLVLGAWIWSSHLGLFVNSKLETPNIDFTRPLCSEAMCVVEATLELSSESWTVESKQEAGRLLLETLGGLQEGSERVPDGVRSIQNLRFQYL